MKKSLLPAAFAIAALSCGAQTIQLDYYASLDGLSGSELKTAVHKLVTTDVKMLSYGSGSVKTWWGFYVTDCKDGNTVIDRYSPETFTFADRGSSVSGMNIEHSFPKSWWGGAENNAYKDLFNLMPCESTINNHKSNYPMGVVDNVWRTNGTTKVGSRSGESTAATYRYWEPADNWKGDFARGYFYMATAYQDFTWSGDQSPRILTTGAFPTLQPWASELYLQWNSADPADEIETLRNSKVALLQGNRNPFVDFPNLAEYIWGDSVDTPFHPLTSVKSAPYVGGSSIKEQGQPRDAVYNCTFLGDRGNCSIETGAGSASGINVWTNTAEYGWKGSGAKGSTDNLTRYATDATLLTPEIDLTNYRSAFLSFDHAVNFATAPYTNLTVIARAEGTDHTLTVHRWPLGNKWDFYSSGTVDLTPYAGKKVKVGFHYTSTTSEAPTWEIKNLKLEAVAGNTSVELIPENPAEADPNAPEEYYTIDGRRLTATEGIRGIIILRRGSSVSKILLN